MTVSSETSRVAYVGSGTTGPFTVPFYFLKNADLLLIKTEIATGVETSMALNSDYTLTGAEDPAGGTVTLSQVLTSSYRLTIIRDPERLQGTDYTAYDSFPAESHERGLDRLTMIAQRLDDRLSRSMIQPDGDDANIAALPSKVDRASKYLTFDSDGDPVAAAAPAGTTLVSGFMATVLDDADAAAARATLGAAQALSQNARVENFSLDFSFAAGAMTARVRQAGVVNDPTTTSPVKAVFRSYPTTSGVLTERTHTAALSLAVSSGSTLGRSLASTKGYLFWYLIDYNGAIELAVSGKFHGWSGVISTTAEAGNADSPVLMYSETARSNVPFVCAAMTIDTQTTAGTWAAAPTDIRIAPFTVPDCAFRAYRATDQTGVGDLTYTKFLATAEQMDISGDYDATNSRFVAPMPGVYTFHGAVHPKNAIAGMEVIALLYLNGVAVAQGYLKMDSTGNAETAHVHATLAMNTHDYMELWLRHNRGTTEDFWGNITLMPFSGVRVGTGAA